MSPRPTALRLALATGLVLTLLAGSGCVYWRLGRLRSQLAQFSRYFEVRADPGPTITFRQPTLQPGDIAWLLDLPPGEIRTEGDVTQQIWLLQKRQVIESEPEQLARVDCRAVVRDGRIAAISLPERFNRIIDQEFLEKSFAGSDAGPLDPGSFRTGWALRNTLGIPDEARVRELLGSPGTLTETSTHRVLAYEYDVIRNGALAPDTPPDCTGQFTFSRDHGRLVLAHARYGRLEVRVVSNDGSDYRVILHREPKGPSRPATPMGFRRSGTLVRWDG